MVIYDICHSLGIFGSVQTWVAQSDWDRPLLDAEAVGTVLGVQPNTVIQLSARGALPEASERVGRKNAWPPAPVYRYALGNRPVSGVRVPRLFPRSPAPAPATFIGARTIPLPGDGPGFVVYEWVPADGAAGVIRLAYPIGDALGSHGRMYEAQDLYAQFGDGGAVAVPAAEVMDGYPSVYVADATTTEIGSEYPWRYLAGLLRVDLPWWPQGLRREQAMRAWRPGAAVQTVSPYMDGLDADALIDLIDSGTTELAAGALAQRAALVRRRQVCGDYRADGSHKYPDMLGFVHAARPDVAVSGDDPASWTWDQAAAVLHHAVPSPAAAAAILAVIDAAPVAVSTVTVARTEVHPLARQWADRLEPFTGPDELGDHLVAKKAGRIPLHERLRDGYNGDCWAGRTVDGTVHATVGIRVPGRGAATSAVLLGIDAAFFRDEAGTVWPLPHPDRGSFHSGFPGHGPGDFARAIVRIAKDSGSPVATGPDYAPDSRLWALVSTQPPPLEFDIPSLLARR
jgi:hypothetical protein